MVNTSHTHARRLIVQAGAFGEHTFTEVRYEDGDSTKVMPVHGKYFEVGLPPSTSIRLDMGMKRFSNRPSYAFPWHGERIPAPFQ